MTLRSKVNKALVQTADIRQDIINYYRDKKVFPQSNTDISAATPLILEPGNEVVVNENGFILYFTAVPLTEKEKA